MMPDELPVTWTEHAPGPDCLAYSPSDVVPPRVLGFTHVVWWKPSTGEVVATAELGAPVPAWSPIEDFARAPLLWQGDQA